jgi:hypothetical protein
MNTTAYVSEEEPFDTSVMKSTLLATDAKPTKFQRRQAA